MSSTVTATWVRRPRGTIGADGNSGVLLGASCTCQPRWRFTKIRNPRLAAPPAARQRVVAAGVEQHVLEVGVEGVRPDQASIVNWSV